MSDAVIERAASLSCFTSPSRVEPLGGGITNINLKVSDEGRDYVVRLGDDIAQHGVARWNELALSRAANDAGISPRVVHHEPGVLVLEFLKARTFDEADVRDPANLPRIIDLVRRAHRTLGNHLTSPVLAFWPFQVNRTYVSRLKQDGSTHRALLPALLAKQERLEAATGPVDMVVGHNDLLAGNLLDDGTRLWLIDWEYGGFNTPLFDLAGLAGNNSLSELQEHEMLRQYFDRDPGHHWRAYQAMKCTSLMREALWSMVSEIHSEIDFDYAAYSAENLDRFERAFTEFQNA